MQSLKNMGVLLDIFKYSPTDEQKTNYCTNSIYIQNDLVDKIAFYNLRSIIENFDAKLIVIKDHNIDKEKIEALFLENNQENNNYFVYGTEKKKDVKYRILKTTDDLNQSIKSAFKEIFIFLSRGDILSEFDEVQIETYKNKIKIMVFKTFDFDFVLYSPQTNKPEIYFVEYKSSIIKLPFPDGFEKNGNHPSNDIIDRIQSTHHFTILSADAGYGKSSFCEHLFQKWINDEYAGYWFIKIKLPEFNTIENETVASALAKYLKLTPWQLNCLEFDMKQKNKVTFLLDGLDEVKDEEQLKNFNSWIKMLPLENISILLTTRPYATHKLNLPSSSQYESVNYATLKKYNSEQQRKYIERNLEMIDENNNIDVRKYSERIYSHLENNSKKIQLKCICTPLESFLFLKVLESEILNQQNELDIEHVLKKTENLITVKLFEKFIEAKLELFFKKHVNVEIKSRRFLFTFSAAYIDILMVFAFKQAFKLDYKFINEILSKYTYFNSKMIEIDLPDSGLVTVESVDEKEYYIKFNHETYQEYFAALFFLKIILFQIINEDIKNEILEKIYDSKYKTIITMASSIVTNCTSLLPNLDPVYHQIKFWETICENEEILGVKIFISFLPH